MKYLDGLNIDVQNIKLDNPKNVAVIEKLATQLGEIRRKSFRQIKERFRKLIAEAKIAERYGETKAKQMLQELVIEEYEEEMEELIRVAAANEALVTLLDARLHATKNLLYPTQALEVQPTKH